MQFLEDESDMMQIKSFVSSPTLMKKCSSVIEDVTCRGVLRKTGPQENNDRMFLSSHIPCSHSHTIHFIVGVRWSAGLLST